jgi:hypothetical protein
MLKLLAWRCRGRGLLPFYLPRVWKSTVIQNGVPASSCAKYLFPIFPLSSQETIISFLNFHKFFWLLNQIFFICQKRKNRHFIWSNFGSSFRIILSPSSAYESSSVINNKRLIPTAGSITCGTIFLLVCGSTIDKSFLENSVCFNKS